MGKTKVDIERGSEKRLEKMEYIQIFSFEQECMENSYPCIWTLTYGFYLVSTLGYSNLLGTKRPFCCLTSTVLVPLYQLTVKVL